MSTIQKSKTFVANVGHGLAKIPAAVALFANVLAALSCGNTTSPLQQGQKEPPVDPKYLPDGPTMVNGDIKFTINPNWTNAEAVKAVNQGLRHLTAQSEELITIYNEWYAQAVRDGGWQAADKKDMANRILTGERALRDGYGSSSIAGIKQADGITAMANFGGDEHLATYYLKALHNASYIAASTKATPAELATIQAKVDEERIVLERDGFPEWPRGTNPVSFIKQQLVQNALNTPSYVFAPGSQTKIAQQVEDYGQFMAMADDLTKMGYTLTNLSNRSAMQNFVIEDNYNEPAPIGRTHAQELAGLVK